MKKNEISLVSANDRDNYGDLVLPKLVERYGKKYCNTDYVYRYYSTSDSNLEQIGGNETHSLDKIPEDALAVIFAGGEILANDYIDALIYKQKNNMGVFILKFLRKFFYGFGNKLSKFFLSGKFQLPWYYIANDIEQLVYYNAVGGTNINRLNNEQLHELSTVINRSTSFFVRDKLTAYRIKELLGIDVKLIPDTAVILSTLYTIEDIEKLVTPSVKDTVDSLGSYFTLQVNDFEGEKHINQLVEDINLLYNNTSTSCALLPIGKAKGHEDQVVLYKISEKCDKSAKYIDTKTIYDVMYVIAHSGCFIGTSLHGNITSFSYGKPHIALTNHVAKTVSFISTWEKIEKPFVNPGIELQEYVQNVIGTKIDSALVDSIKEPVLLYFQSIFDKLHELEFEE